MNYKDLIPVADIETQGFDFDRYLIELGSGGVGLYFKVPPLCIKRAIKLLPVGVGIESPQIVHMRIKSLPLDVRRGGLCLDPLDAMDLYLNGSVKTRFGFGCDGAFKVSISPQEVRYKDVCIRRSEIEHLYKKIQSNKPLKKKKIPSENTRDRVVLDFIIRVMREESRTPCKNEALRYLRRISQVNDGGSETIYEVTEKIITWDGPGDVGVDYLVKSFITSFPGLKRRAQEEWESFGVGSQNYG